MMEQVLTYLAKKVFDELCTRLKEGLKADLAAQAQLLVDRLDRIEEKIDRQLALPLKAGVTFLRLGKLEEAITELVRAESADAYSSVAKLWLGVALLSDGNATAALGYIEHAILLNPFVASQIVASYDEFFPSSIMQLNSARPTQWVQQLPNEEVLGTLKSDWTTGLKTLGKELGSGFAARRSAGISAISISGKHPVICWRLGGDLSYDYDEVTSVFDMDTGRCLWSVLTKNTVLCFATLRHAILRAGTEPIQYEFRDLETGKMARLMTRDYFETVFCPATIDLQALGVFTKSNKRMMEASVAYGKTRVELRKGWRSFLRSFVDHDHDYLTLEETELLDDPFRFGPHSFRVVNQWRHAHIFYPQAGPKCGLAGTSIVARIS